MKNSVQIGNNTNLSSPYNYSSTNHRFIILGRNYCTSNFTILSQYYVHACYQTQHKKKYSFHRHFVLMLKNKFKCR